MKRILPLASILMAATLAATLAVAQSADEFRRQVASLVASYRWDEARMLVSKGLSQFSDDSYLLVVGAALQSRAGHWDRAEPLLQRALRTRLSPEELRLAAGVRLQQGERIAARQLLQRAIRQAPLDALTRYQLAYVLLVDGDAEAARIEIDEAVRLDPRSSRFRRFYALVLGRLGRDEEAYSQLREAQRVAPTDTRLLLRLSDRERLRGRFEQALEYLDLAIELDPENPIYPSEAAELYSRLKRHEEAASSQERAAELQVAFDVYVEALQLAGRDQVEEAVAVLEPVVGRHPEFYTGALLLGQLHRRLGQQGKALQIYLDLLAGDPARSEAREEMAWIRAQAGELEAALETLQQGSSHSLNALLLEGHRSLELAHWTEAIHYFRQVEAHYPLDPKLLQLISFSLNEMGEVEQALRYLEKASRLLPADASIHSDARTVRAEYGLQRIESQDWTEAEALFRELVREERANPEHKFHLGYALQGQGKTEQAIVEYQRGLRIDAGAEWARVNLAACLYAVGRQSEATAHWRWLVEQNETPEHVYNLGLSLIRELELDKGWRLVHQAAREGHSRARRLIRRAQH